MARLARILLYELCRPQRPRGALATSGSVFEGDLCGDDFKVKFDGS